MIVIRIAFVVHSLQIGGIERSVTRIISGLSRDLFVPFVICLDRTGPTATWLDADVPVVEIKKRSGNDIRSILRLASVLREHRIDLVQSHNWGTLIETATARKLARVKYHIHAERGTVLGVRETAGLRPRLRSIAMRLVLASVSQVMSNAHSVAQRVEKLCGYPSSKIRIIPNGIRGYSTNGRAQYREKILDSLSIPRDAMIVGSVGRLHEVKGFDVLIRAFSKLPTDTRETHLLIVGEGDQRKKLEQIASELNIARRIHLVGHQEDIEHWLLAIDVYVNSSRSEGMSQAIVEAMSVGLPIVATDVGDARQMINRDEAHCGIVCLPDDAENLYEAITALLGDEDLRYEYQQNAKQCHQSFFTLQKFHEAIADLYRQTAMVSSSSTGSTGESPMSQPLIRSEPKLLEKREGDS